MFSNTYIYIYIYTVCICTCIDKAGDWSQMSSLLCVECVRILHTYICIYIYIYIYIYTQIMHIHVYVHVHTVYICRYIDRTRLGFP